MSPELPGSSLPPSSPVMPLPRVPGTGPAVPAIKLRVKTSDPKLVRPAPSARDEYHAAISTSPRSTPYVAAVVPQTPVVPKSTLSGLPLPTGVAPQRTTDEVAVAVADATVNTLEEKLPLVTLEAIEALVPGDTVIFKSGTRRKVLEIDDASGEMKVRTTKRFSHEEIDGKFRSGTGEQDQALMLADYSHLHKDDVIRPTFKVAEGNGTEFTIVKIQKPADTVTGVVLSFNQVFPKGFAGDLEYIKEIVKKPSFKKVIFNKVPPAPTDAPTA